MNEGGGVGVAHGTSRHNKFGVTCTWTVSFAGFNYYYYSFAPQLLQQLLSGSLSVSQILHV
jgi:hypothetical protein